MDRKGRCYGPFRNSQEFYAARAKVVVDDEIRIAKASTSSDDGTEEHSNAHVNSALLHLKAAAHAGAARYRSGPFILKHIDLHWQNILLDKDCTVNGIIDWEWAHTVPADSFTPLPFNFAVTLQPSHQMNVTGHEKIAWGFFQLLEEADATYDDRKVTFDIASIQGSPEIEIESCFDAYNWPEYRRAHFDRLSALVRIIAEREKGVARSDGSRVVGIP